MTGTAGDRRRARRDEILELTVARSAAAGSVDLGSQGRRGDARTRSRRDRASDGTGNIVTAGNYRSNSIARTGMLARSRVTVARSRCAARAGRVAARAEAAQRSSTCRAGADACASSSSRPANPDMLARAEYDGALREVSWEMRRRRAVGELPHRLRGAADILGVTFDYPEKSVLAKRWVGAGPYRIWKNRQAGTGSACTRRTTRARRRA